jgi:N-acetylmuramoyl-L-alanine amidase
VFVQDVPVWGFAFFPVYDVQGLSLSIVYSSSLVKDSIIALMAALISLRGICHGATIVLDLGHGGCDPGPVSASGVYEKDINLAVAKLQD